MSEIRKERQGGVSQVAMLETIGKCKECVKNNKLSLSVQKTPVVIVALR